MIMGVRIISLTFYFTFPRYFWSYLLFQRFWFCGPRRCGKQTMNTWPAECNDTRTCVPYSSYLDAIASLLASELKGRWRRQSLAWPLTKLRGCGHREAHLWDVIPFHQANDTVNDHQACFALGSLINVAAGRTHVWSPVCPINIEIHGSSAILCSTAVVMTTERRSQENEDDTSFRSLAPAFDAYVKMFSVHASWR